MSEAKARISVTLDKDILEEMDASRETSRSKYINGVLLCSLAIEQDIGIRNLKDK